MNPLKALGGTSDILPGESERWQRLEETARRVLGLYGYREIRTPLIEEAGLFTGSLGETAEIVTKQMYLFQDRGGRSVALRPEGTASVVRAFIEHGLGKTGGLSRFYYLGPMFRAERPQAGRRRQFHQLGVEVFGSASPYQDIEVIMLLMELLEEMGVSVAKETGDKGAVLRINNLGCREDRPKLLKQLKEYFTEHVKELCPDCQRRLETNPLRILDCKREKRRGLEYGSIIRSKWLCEPCRNHVERVYETLKGRGIYSEWDNHLVRGLDYYTRTAFEVIHTGLGAQDAIGGGGRYDYLVEALGGTATPAIGFAIGLERVLMVQEQAASLEKNGVKVFIATVTPEQIPIALDWAKNLRAKGISTTTNLEDRPLRRQLEQASKLAVKLALIFGPEEVEKKVALIKEMKSGQQAEQALSGLVATVESRLNAEGRGEL